MERHVESPSAYKYPAPTDEETITLRKVAGRIPKTAYLICMVELLGSASYWGAGAVFNNYMQFPLPEGGNGTGAVPKGNPNGHAGALNMGLTFAFATNMLFALFCYAVPVFGAWWADAKAGRFKAMVWAVLFGAVGHVIMIGGAAPALLKAGKGLAPFLVSYSLLAFGSGIIKPLIAPILLDQLEHQKPYTKTLKSEEKVLVDPEITIQRILILFYAFMNLGAFFAIVTTFAEKYAGFWVAFLLSWIAYLPIPFLLIFMNKRLIKKPVVGSEMVQFFKVICAAIKGNKWKLWGRDYWDAARPATLAAKGRTVTWTDKFVADVYRTLEACRVFLYMPLHGTTNAAISFIGSYQAAAMTSGGLPNDLLANLNPLVILVFTPILCYGFYPFLSRRNIRLGRIDRIASGFIMTTLSATLAAIVQWRVYETSPCSFHASTCPEVSPISIWWQFPSICLGAISEMFVNVTGYELAYARAPPNMKSLVTAMFLVTNAIFITLASWVIPLIKDPNLIWVWGSLAVALGVQTVIFVWRQRHMNDDEFMLYEDEWLETTPSPATENK